jgi:uncharacterized protein (TIRG00374 family)
MKRKTDSPTPAAHFVLKGLLPVCVGLGVTALLYHHEFGTGRAMAMTFTMSDAWAVGVALLLMAMKDFAQSARYRLMCRPAVLPWLKALRTNYLCEFTSAITPSAVGGSALIMAYLHREGVTAGRGTMVMISTLLLDELLFVVMAPLCLVCFPSDVLFGLPGGLSTALRYSFAAVCVLLVAYTALLYYALLRNPLLVGRLLQWLTKMPLLRRFRPSVQRFTEEMRTSGEEMKHQTPLFWVKAAALTLCAWTSRYAVACALFLPSVPVAKQFLVFCRQLVLWVVMMVAPTPGGSGVSEYLFSQYYSDLSLTAAQILFITCFWRLLTYYVYLFAGFCILPSWMKMSR